MGKASFTVLQDVSGRIQLYIQSNHLGQELMKLFCTLILATLSVQKASCLKLKPVNSLSK